MARIPLHRKKIKITPADIISVIFLLIFLLVFGRLAFPADLSEWQKPMAEEIVIAYTDYLLALDENITDTAVEISTMKFNRKINLILLKYNKLILSERKDEKKRSIKFKQGEEEL